MNNKVNAELKNFKELANRIPSEITKETPKEVVEEMYQDFIVIIGAVGRIDEAVSNNMELNKGVTKR